MEEKKCNETNLELVNWLRNYNGDNKPTLENYKDCSLTNPEMKKYMILENLVRLSLYQLQENDPTSDPFLCSETKDIVEFICEQNNVFVPSLPIFKFKNKTLSTDDLRMTFEELKNMVLNEPETDFIIYKWTVDGEYLDVKGLIIK